MAPQKEEEEGEEEAAVATTPYREIRASYTDTHIVVYQAYKAAIADAAVSTQKLNASPDFRPGHMTWIKPSWGWMMYRSGYAAKDAGQERVLAITMPREHFVGLLERAVLTSHGGESAPPPSRRREDGDRTGNGNGAGAGTGRDDGLNRVKSVDVKVQWDPERSAKLETLPHRSIQIGIPGALSETWARRWIANIEDVTDKAKKLKDAIDERPEVTIQELTEMGLIPEERPFPVPLEVQERLQMGIPKEVSKRSKDGAKGAQRHKTTNTQE